jgi:hypothetical protein
MITFSVEIEVTEIVTGRLPQKEDVQMKILMSLLSLALGVSLVVIGGTLFPQNSYAKNPPSEWQQMNLAGLHPYASGSNGSVQVSSAPSQWQQMNLGGLHAYASDMRGPIQTSSAPSEYEQMTTAGMHPFAG